MSDSSIFWLQENLISYNHDLNLLEFEFGHLSTEEIKFDYESIPNLGVWMYLLATTIFKLLWYVVLCELNDAAEAKKDAFISWLIRGH